MLEVTGVLRPECLTSTLPDRQRHTLTSLAAVTAGPRFKLRGELARALKAVVAGDTVILCPARMEHGMLTRTRSAVPR
jgi:hypothetical protein